MAKADKKHVGVGATGKGTGVGARTDLPPGTLAESMVLSNRDKAQHSRSRGLDSKAVQGEQRQDQAGSHKRKT